MDGIELGQVIRSDEGLKDTALILLTSAPRQGDGHDFAAAGFAGYLVKPVPSADLEAALGIVVDGRVPGRLVTRYTLAEARHESAARIASEPLGLQGLGRGGQPGQPETGHVSAQEGGLRGGARRHRQRGRRDGAAVRVRLDLDGLSDAADGRL